MKKKVMVLFQRLGPYHIARLRALQSAADLLVLQVVRQDCTYAWDLIDSEDDLIIETLFDNDGELSGARPAEIMDKLSGYLDNFTPAAFAVPGWADLTALISVYACLLKKIPIVIMSASTYHDAPRHWFREMIKKRVVSTASSFLVGGEPQREYLQMLGVSVDTIYEGYDVVDNRHFTPNTSTRLQGKKIRSRDLGAPDHVLLTCCRFIPKKNLFLLLDAFHCYSKKLQENDQKRSSKLILLGDGILKEELMMHAEKSGMSDDVIFPGFVQYNELPAYYCMADLFILASTSEQWGLVVNEAMASGLPVLVSSHCGCSVDLVKDGYNGYQFNPHDVTGLADKMNLILSNPEERRKMGERSMSLVRKWNPDLFAQNMLKAITKCLLDEKRMISLHDILFMKTLIGYQHYLNNSRRPSNC